MYCVSIVRIMPVHYWMVEWNIKNNTLLNISLGTSGPIPLIHKRNKSPLNKDVRWHGGVTPGPQYIALNVSPGLVGYFFYISHKLLDYWILILILCTALAKGSLISEIHPGQNLGPLGFFTTRNPPCSTVWSQLGCFYHRYVEDIWSCDKRTALFYGYI